jgi:hypothetical protein
MSNLSNGDYVLATKYHDGDPGDHFAVGFYAGTLEGRPDRYLVVDINGKPFRANGFRRIKKISTARGVWIIEHLGLIEGSSHSVWWWVRRPMIEKGE